MTQPLRTNVDTTYPDDPNDPAWTPALKAQATKEHQQAHDLLHATRLDVAPTAPTAQPGLRYLWVQTGLGVDGGDFTFWIEDGTA